MVIIVEKESFMSAIPIQKTLSKEELYTLIQNYQKNHDQKSKEMIILSNTKLVLSLMKRFYQKSNHYEDLFQVGIVGLIKAVDHFDTNYQLQFSTYAVPLIIGEMKRYLRDNTQVKISRPIKDLAYAILKEKEKYLNQYQREPTIQELSQNLNIEKQNIIEAMQSTQSIASFQDAVGNDDQWMRLCKVIEREDLSSDKRFSTNTDRVKNRDELISILSQVFQKNSMDYWLSSFKLNNIPSGPVNTIDKTLNDLQVIDRNLIASILHPFCGEIKLLRNPIHIDNSNLDIERHPPLLGEHTNEILKELGYSDREIEELKEKGVI